MAITATTRVVSVEEYLDYLSQDVENAKGKATDWMGTALVSHLRYAFQNGWVTNPMFPATMPTTADLQWMVDQWAGV